MFADEAKHSAVSPILFQYKNHMSKEKKMLSSKFNIEIVYSDKNQYDVAVILFYFGFQEVLKRKCRAVGEIKTGSCTGWRKR